MTSKAEVANALARQGGNRIRDWVAGTYPILTPSPTTTPNQRTRQVARVVTGAQLATGWRVTLGPLAFMSGAVSGAAGAPGVVAHVMWGWDGTRFEADVDWPQGGTHFNVWGAEVTVDLVVPDTFTTDPALPGSLPTTGVQGGAHIAPAASAGGPSPTRTLWSGVVAGGAFSGAIAVPAMATGMRWHQLDNAGAGAAIAISFQGAQNATFALLTQTTPTGIYTSSESTWPSDEGLTLHPSTRFVRFHNDGAANLSLQLEFVLDLE